MVVEVARQQLLYMLAIIPVPKLEILKLFSFPIFPSKQSPGLIIPWAHCFPCPFPSYYS